MKLVYVLALPHPLERYQLDIPLDIVHELADGHGLTAVLHVRLTEADLYDLQPERVAVLRAELVGIQLAKDKTRFPAALSKSSLIVPDSP